MVFGTDMDSKNKEKGILKLEPRQRSDAKSVLTPQISYERPPSSPQPSVDRLSVTWADPGSMTSGANLFHLPTETPATEVKFSPSTGEGSEDDDYSASLSAVLHQRRASVRRSRKGRARRPSSPFLADEMRSRRRSSVFTTSSGDTAISIDEQPVVSQVQIFQNIQLHKEVLGSVKQQPLGMRRKLKIVHQAKAYIKRHEGQLQERLAQSKSTKDIYARFNILLATKWQQLKREAANTSNLLIPWELRIKEIESHFGSVVASYFTFLRWLFWVNLVIGFILLVFVIIPECLTANPLQDGERKIIMEEERQNATNLLTLWEFEGALKYSPIFYGYYSNIERTEYRMPLAYFLTGLVVYIYSFVAILRKMAENSRMSKLSEKDDECIFSWKLFTGWDYMIGNAETAHNRIASVILGFKEALLEEAEKKKNLRNWRIISLRALVNICVIILLGVSAYAVVTVVSRSYDNLKIRSWWRENEITIVVTLISITFPVCFDLLGFLEHYHPRKQLRLQLARIMLLNLLNLYSLIFALFSKIEGMSRDLVSLQPTLHMNVTIIPVLNISETAEARLPLACFEIRVPCAPCETIISRPMSYSSTSTQNPNFTISNITNKINPILYRSMRYLNFTLKENKINDPKDDKTIIQKEIERLRNLSMLLGSGDANDDISEANDTEFNEIFEVQSSTDIEITPLSSESYLNYEPTTQSSTDTLFTTTQRGEFLSSTSSSYYDMTSSSEALFRDRLSNTDPFYSSTRSVDGTTSSDITEHSTDKATKTPRFNYITSTESNYVTTTDATSITDSDSTKYGVYPLETTPTAITDVSSTFEEVIACSNITFNCSINCGDMNITKVYFMTNCKVIATKCYITKCTILKENFEDINRNQTNSSIIDITYIDSNHRKMYNLSTETRKKLLKLCWETMFGQELVKLTMMDLVFVLLGTLFMDFFRALFVRYMNRCWCWDLEKKFPEYGDFKIAENILHLINNQGMVWMGMFFSPGLVVLNVFKLVIMMYLRSWAVMTCNVPHEVVFRVSKSNNFYLALLLTMLFLCVLPVGYTVVWVTPSWHCGPFSEYDKIYKILTYNIYKILPKHLNFALEYIASPAIVIPLLVLLILIIYYLISLTNSLREANIDLKIQLRRERTEERRKMFQLADTRRRGESSSIDNTPFARWKKALPSLPQTKSIDSDDRKSAMESNKDTIKNSNKKKGIFAKIVGLAVDKKTAVETVNREHVTKKLTIDDETDTSFHESLSKEILKMRDITVINNIELRKKNGVEFKTNDNNAQSKSLVEDDDSIENDLINKVDKSEYSDNFTTSKIKESVNNERAHKKQSNEKFKQKKQSSESSNMSKNNDSIGSIIPVITISTTESDDEVLQVPEKSETVARIDNENVNKQIEQKDKQRGNLKRNKNCPDLKSLQRQSSVDSINEKKQKNKKSEDAGHKYQYSL